MPKFTLKVPHYHQDGPNCWWYVHRMILDYHRNSEDWLTAFAEAPNRGLPFETIESVLGDLHYKRLKPSEFNLDTKTTDVVRILSERGPLFIPCCETFHWRAGHALVLCGVVENKGQEFPDKELIVFLDPAAKDKKDGGKIKWPFDFAIILMDLQKNSNQTPFYYDGPERRSIVSRGPDEMPNSDKTMEEFDQLTKRLQELAKSLNSSS